MSGFSEAPDQATPTPNVPAQTAPAATAPAATAPAATAPAKPNHHRGEVGLLLDGITHLLRPTFAALVAAEDELGSLFALVERASGGELRLGEMVALFWHCLAHPSDHSREAFAEAVTEAGLAACAPALRGLLVQVLKGGG